MTSNEEFLKLYNDIENQIIIKYNLPENYQGALVFFKKMQKNRDVQIKLDQVRKLRNFLVHEDFVKDYDMFTVSLDVINFLKDLLDKLINPVKAINICSKKANIISASLISKLTYVMKMMNKYGYSHVPILNDKNVVIGVFSESTLFTYALKEKKDIIINENTLIKDFYKYLLLNNHSSDQYAFVNENYDIKAIIDLFKKNQMKTKKIKMIFITKDANPTNPLIGVITPYDLFKI